MGLRLITPPAAMPVTIEEARLQCRVLGEDADDTAYLTALITVATDHVEKYTGRAIVEQTWELVADGFADEMMLARGPVRSIVSVKYFDIDDAEQTLDAATYELDDVSDPQLLLKAPGASWPAVAEGRNRVIVRFTAGYDAPPPAIRMAILLLIGLWFNNREAATEAELSEMPHAVEALLVNYRSFA